MPVIRPRIARLVLIASTAAVVSPGWGQETQPTAVTVATRHVPPFAIRNDDGSWQGISIELWERICDDLGLRSDYREVELQEMIRGVEAGEYAAAVGALTMTADRERKVDFTHPFYNSGLGIAVPGQPVSGWMRVLRSLVSLRFLQAVAALAVLLLGLGFLVWWFERKRNPDQFGGGRAQGIGAGFWWSAVTMTTVGYGDKAPVTVGGRLVALVWMFASIIIISSFTAAIASALTVSQLETGIQGPADLPGARVGTVARSTSEAYLRDKRARVQAFPMPADALAALAEGDVEAVVYDEPILRYLVNNDMSEPIRVLPQTFEPQNYAIALPHQSPRREAINRRVLEITSEPQWQDVLYRYLGE